MQSVKRIDWLTCHNAFFSDMHLSIYMRNDKTHEKCPSFEFSSHNNIGTSKSQFPIETSTQYGRLKLQV